MTLRAPFPWFGGKSRAASLIWERFGTVANYVEPFAGSLAVLLAAPSPAPTETVNDRDGYLVNFWRAVQAAPEAVWQHADQPVSEADLHARHVWLLAQGDFREQMLTDPHFYDVKIAGWWVWGLSLWIGDGWCADCTDRPTDRPTDQTTTAPQQRPRRPHRKIPELGSDRGVLRASFRNSPAGVAYAVSQSVSLLPAKCPSSGRSGPSGSSTAQGGVFDDLAARLRDVRIACGDWSRVVTPSVTWRHGMTAVLLDPPYDDGEHAIRYSGGGSVTAAVRAWAMENGDRADMRIALCGYEGEHDMPASWQCVPWKAQGGYGSQGDGRGRENATRERVWFSPHCLTAAQQSLFDGPPTYDERQAGAGQCLHCDRVSVTTPSRCESADACVFGARP
jgi:DNA adenine methylase